MDVIYKYGPLEPGGDAIWVAGTPLKLARQGGWPGAHQKLHCWCRVAIANDGTQLSSTRKVRVIPTGEKYIGEYIDTFLDESGLVWHLVTAD
jgi:hypothetical protein